MKKFKVKAVLFDLWDTLAFTPAKNDIFNQLQERLGLNELTHWQFIDSCQKSMMLKPFLDEKQMLRSLCEYFSLEYGEIILGDLTSIWIEGIKKNTLYKDSKKALNHFKGKKPIALISNTECFGWNSIKEKHKLHKEFNQITLSFETSLLKPHPKIFHLTLKKLGVKPDETVMIGNSIKLDMEGAKRAGIKSILVDRENKHEKFNKADARINSLEELTDLIE